MACQNFLPDLILGEDMRHAWTKEQIAILSKNPHVSCFSKNGQMYLNREFIKQLYAAWSVKKSLQTIELFFKTCGFPCDILPKEYFYCINDRLKKIDAKKSPQSVSDNPSADSSNDIRSPRLSQYADHPLVVKGSNNRYCLGDVFYNEALRLFQLGFSIAQILEVYEIEASVIPAGTLKKMY